MAYKLKKEESHVEHCFECKEAFALEEKHERDFISSGLCPKCFNKVMEAANGSIEYYCMNICKTIDKIINDINEINNCIKIFLDDKKGGK